MDLQTLNLCACLEMVSVLCNYGVTSLKIRSTHAVNKILIDPEHEGAALFPNATVLAQ
jgi:hypothetical protein